MATPIHRALGGLCIALVIALSAPAAVAAPPPGGSNSPLNEVLVQLAALQTQVAALQASVAALTTNVGTVQTGLNNVYSEVIDCTLSAKQEGKCDRVRETKASACFELGVLEATLLAKWLGRFEAKAEGGAGWTSGPDGKIVAEAKAPVGPIPSNFGIESGPKMAIKGEICVEMPLEVLPPVGIRSGGTTLAATRSTAAEDEFDALAERFEEISATIVPLVMDRVDSRMPSGQRLATGVQAIERLGDGDLSLIGGDLLSDPQLLELADILPVPVTLRTLIQNPAALSSRLPAFNGSARQRIAALCDPQTGLSVVRSPLFAGTTGQICAHLESVPDFDDVAAQLLDIPEATSAIVDGLLDKTQQIIQNRTNPFCSRPLFAGTRLCQ